MQKVLRTWWAMTVWETVYLQEDLIIFTSQTFIKAGKLVDLWLFSLGWEYTLAITREMVINETQSTWVLKKYQM